MWPNPQETSDLVKFPKEILKEKLPFCSEKRLYFSSKLDNVHFKSIVDIWRQFVNINYWLLSLISNEWHEWNCVKSVRIRSFSGLDFLAFGLNTAIYGICGFSSNVGKYGPQKLWIRTLFTLCDIGKRRTNSFMTVIPVI